MPSLRELQQRFYDAVASADADPLAASIRSNAIGAAARIAVYRNNAREGFRKALLADYPVTEQLVGAECFRGLARAYLSEHPSRSGDLQGFGHELPAFLDSHYGGGEFAYLGDVARLEWAVAEALVAPDAEPASLNVLASIGAERLEALGLLLHPALRVVRSPYPILRIWRQHQAGTDVQDRIDLSAGGEAVVVLRNGERIELRSASDAEWSFLAALARSATLGDAVDAALAADLGFDLQRALARAFALGLVVGCEPAQNRIPLH